MLVGGRAQANPRGRQGVVGAALSFYVVHEKNAGTTSEKITALVLQKKAQQHEKAIAAERAAAAKRAAALAARESAEAAVAASAATALKKELRKASQYRMPALERVLSELEARGAGSAAAAGGGGGGGGAAQGGRRRAASPAARSTKAAAAAPVAEEAAPAAATNGGGAVFVHFIPPPLRQEGKKDLPWMVHCCDGSGCKEAKHVSFHSITGFATCEGAPPEVAEGTSCGCTTIANHHLRGFGCVRWEEGHHAIVEDEGSVLADADGRTYLNKAKKLQQRVDVLEKRLAGIDVKGGAAVAVD